MSQLHEEFAGFDLPAAKFIGRQWQSAYSRSCVQTKDQFYAMCQHLSTRPCVSVDTETNSLDVIRGNPIGFSFYDGLQDAYYTPTHHLIGQNVGLTDTQIRDALFDTFKDKFLIFFNRKFDIPMFKHYDFLDLSKVAKCLDASVPMFITNANSHMPGLKPSVRHILGWEMITYGEVTGDVNMERRNPLEVYSYASDDAICTFHLYVALARVAFDQWGLGAIGQLDESTLDSLIKLEATPIPVSSAQAIRVQEELEAKSAMLETQLYDLVGKQFSFNSPKQLAEVLLNAGVPLTDKTKNGGYSTAADTLEPYRDSFPIVDLIFSIKEANKTMSYCEKLRQPHIWKNFTEKQRSLFYVPQARRLSMREDQEFGIGGYTTNNVPTGRFSAAGVDIDKKTKKILSLHSVQVHLIPKSEPVPGCHLIKLTERVPESPTLALYDEDSLLYVCVGLCPFLDKQNQAPVCLNKFDKCEGVN